jgi:dihydroneopterin aldolase
MATIEMEIEVRTEIGIAPTERGKVQSLTITLKVEVADPHSDAAARSGRISETLDYGKLRLSSTRSSLNGVGICSRRSPPPFASASAA